MTIQRRTLLRGIAAGTACVVAGPTLARADTPDGTTGDESTPEAGTATVTAADGTSWTIDDVDTNRAAGQLIRYTPDYGFTTFTDTTGAEAALEGTSTANAYRVIEVNADRGNTTIPANGMVLSAGAGEGDDDPVAFISDHFAVGDVVTITRPTDAESSQQVTVVDPTAESNPEGAKLPGFRGTDQLIIYTPQYGESTGTNEWGYEFTVRDDVVVASGSTSDSSIPTDGFVLSGHGVMADWLLANDYAGATVSRDGDTVTVRRDLETHISNATSEVESAAEAVEASHDAFVNAPIDKAREAVATGREWIAKAKDVTGTDDQAALHYCDAAVAAAHDAYFLSLPSRPADARGVWYRPVEKSAEAIRTTLTRMRETGVNELYLETLWGGYTLYPSAVNEAHDLPRQRPEFATFDPLRTWKTEADKLDIGLHAWIDGLAVGNELGDGLGPILTRHPEWVAVGRDHVDDDQPSPSSNGFYWLDVTDPIARTYFIDLCAEMVREYGLSGINLDYMAYPEDGDWQHNFNFSDDARSAFEEQEGLDPLTLSPDETPEAWDTWNTFVDAEYTRLITEIYRRVKADDPTAVVSDAPEGGTEALKIGQWSEVLDVIMPQAYTTDTSAIPKSVTEHLERMTGGQLGYTGTAGMYNRNGSHSTVRQAIAAKHVDAGSLIFAFGQAGPAHARALSMGPWRTSSIAPGAHPLSAAKALLEESLDEIASRYLPRDGIHRSIASALESRLSSVKSTLTGDAPDERLAAANKRLLAVNEIIDREAGNDRIARAVEKLLTLQINYCSKIITYAIARKMR